MPKDVFFLRAESFYNVATALDNIGLRGYGERSLHAQSHGESFLSLFMNRLGGGGLYLFDEPEAALSPARQLSMISVIHQLVEDSSQLIIATHSPILLAYPNAQIYWFSSNGIAPIPYEETEHVRIYQSFINRRETMLKTLME